MVDALSPAGIYERGGGKPKKGSPPKKTKPHTLNNGLIKTVCKKYLLKKKGHRFLNFPEMRIYKAK